ncbi:unnamed protein product, partial [marine sediment metagenome]
MLEEPLMKFEKDASAPILRYDIPSMTAYEGKNYIELDLPLEYFDELKATKIKQVDEILNKNREEIKEYLSKLTKEELEQEMYGLGIKPYTPPEKPPEAI